MTTPVLTTDEVNDAAAWFSRTYTGWTWPELLRALESVLPAAIAQDALPTLLTLSPNEPRHPAEALRRALKKWTRPPAKPTIVPLSVPPPRDTIADGLPQLYSVSEVAQWLNLVVPHRVV